MGAMLGHEAILWWNEKTSSASGEWQEFRGVTRLSVVDPTSEQVLGYIAAGDANHVHLAVAAARKAFPAFPRSSLSERLALLGRMHMLLKERAETLAEAQMGAAISFARASQVPFAAEHIRVQMEVLQKYRFVTVDGRTATAKEAIGVCRSDHTLELAPLPDHRQSSACDRGWLHDRTQAQ